MRHPKPYPTCVFCGSKANSREHAVPKWIGKQLGIKDFLSAEDALVVGLPRRKQPISFRSYRERIFCKGCNSHFKHLEDAVIPILVPMAKGRVLMLDADTRELLALWAAKTAVALLAAADPALGEGVPIDHRTAIRQHGRLSDECWVGYFPWRGGPIISPGRAVVIADNVNPPLRNEAYGAILTFAKLGFKVFGLIDPRHPGHVIGGGLPSMPQFWPPTPGLDAWPPGNATASNRALPDLLNYVPLHTA